MFRCDVDVIELLVQEVQPRVWPEVLSVFLSDKYLLLDQDINVVPVFEKGDKHSI